jgi:hypothetical protein
MRGTPVRMSRRLTLVQFQHVRPVLSSVGLLYDPASGAVLSHAASLKRVSNICVGAASVKRRWQLIRNAASPLNGGWVSPHARA